MFFSKGCVSDSFQTMSSYSSTQRKKCRHHDRGICKYGKNCFQEHPRDICRNDGCSRRNCKFRHPKPCKNGESCPFIRRKGGCAYLHNDASIVGHTNSTSNSNLKEKHFEQTKEEGDYPNCYFKLYSKISKKPLEEEKDSEVFILPKPERKKYFDYNYHLIIEGANQLDLNEIRACQVALVGSERLYERINRNLRNLISEPYFTAEQFKLYKWRENFFYKVFGSWMVDKIWTCHGNWFSHEFDTVPLQLTQFFDDLTVLACSLLDLTDGNQVYFDADEDTANRIIDLYLVKWIKLTWKTWNILDMLDGDLSFSDRIHRVSAAFQDGPPTLEELSIKKALEFKLNLEVLPEKLIFKAKHGMYACMKEFKRPGFLSKEGDETIDKLLSYNENATCRNDCFCQSQKYVVI